MIAVEERNKVDQRYVDYVTDDDIEKRALGEQEEGMKNKSSWIKSFQGGRAKSLEGR